MIIVTGGSGFIGSNIIRRLNLMGYNNIIVVDNLKKGIKFFNLSNLNIIDYIDKEDFLEKIILMKKNFFSKIKVVFHQGACSVTTEWDGKYIMYNNYEYSKQLLHYCIKYNIPFLYASSASVYGNYHKGVFIENRKNENPLTIYAYSKFLFDQYVRAILLKVKKTQICGIRYFNVYGPYEMHKDNMSSLILQFYKQLHKYNKLNLFYGSEKFKRDYIYIDDVVSLNIWLWKNNISGIFNCGTNISIPINIIANIVLNNCIINNIKGSIEYIDIPKGLQRYYQIYTKANLTSLHKLGYKVSYISINNGIIKYLKWLNRYYIE